MIAPDDAEKLRALAADQGLEFPVLVDADLAATRAYGVLNEDAGTLPHPTAVVIDADGVVRYVRVDVDYKVRPSPDELVAALMALP